MARLVYSAICSVDGYTVDEHGDFEWCAPDEEVHAAVNDVERPIGTYLYGRRMYDVLQFWQTLDLTDATRALPAGVRLDLANLASLDLVDERRFASGFVQVSYRPRA